MNKASTEKDTHYRDTLMANVSGDESHPINNGVPMQAHHVISAQGVKISMAEAQMRKVEYDINELNNLVFVPCTFQGACHLNTQLHRSNHTTNKPKEGDLDDEHPRSYHQTVAELVNAVYEKNTGLCPVDNKRKILSDYRSISSVVLLSINSFDRDTQLTRAYESFDINGDLSKVGCAGENKMVAHQAKNGRCHCPVGRDHEYKNVVGGDEIDKPEEIMLKRREAPYILRLGN
jgi:hypothetical protein